MTLTPFRQKRLASETRRDADASFITEGNLSRAVWKLAWPTVITNVLMSATGLINLFFVGRLGKDALAVVGRSEQILFLLMSIITSVSVGTSALVARFIGAGEPDQATEASRQSLILLVLGALISSLGLWFCGEMILRWMNAVGQDLALSALYLRILALVQFQVFLIIVIGAIFRGLGDTRTPMYIMLAVNGLQVAGDWSFIFGCGPIPSFGVTGAAYSWMVSRTVGAILSIYYLLRSPMAASMKGLWNAKFVWFKRIWAIGFPTAIQQTLRTTGSMVFIGILGGLPDGIAAVATLTLGMRIESIAFMPGFAYSMAAITMVGQNLGAEKPERAEKAGWACSYQAMGMMSVAGAAFLLIPRQIIHIFTLDPEVTALGVGYLIANALSQPIGSFGIALSGALQGAGETRVPAWITFFTMWFIRVPLAYLIIGRMGFGANAAWAIMAFTNIVYGLMITYWFKRGDWKRIEI